MQIISAKNAKSQDLKHYYTGIPCKYGHTTKRLVSSTQCVECVRLAHYTYYEKHKDVVLAHISKWQRENKELVNANTRTWRKRNPKNAKAAHRRYYVSIREYKLTSNKVWRANNKPLLQSYNAKRRAQILKATPTWANQQRMLEIYEQSVRLTRETGIKHQVDHMIPLVSNVVCGLHCEANLQIITATENQSKGNTLGS